MFDILYFEKNMLYIKEKKYIYKIQNLTLVMIKHKGVLTTFILVLVEFGLKILK